VHHAQCGGGGAQEVAPKCISSCGQPPTEADQAGGRARSKAAAGRAREEEENQTFHSWSEQLGKTAGHTQTHTHTAPVPSHVSGSQGNDKRAGRTTTAQTRLRRKKNRVILDQQASLGRKRRDETEIKLDSKGQKLRQKGIDPEQKLVRKAVGETRNTTTPKPRNTRLTYVLTKLVTSIKSEKGTI
jgi:hypothetical protein